MTELHFNGNEYEVQNFEVHYTTKPIRKLFFPDGEERWFAPRVSLRADEIDVDLLDALHDDHGTERQFIITTEAFEYVFLAEHVTTQHAESQIGPPHDSEMVEMVEIGFKADPGWVDVFIRETSDE